MRALIAALEALRHPKTGVFPQPPRLESAPAQCVRMVKYDGDAPRA